MPYLVDGYNHAGGTNTPAWRARLFLWKRVFQIELPWTEGISRLSSRYRSGTVVGAP